MLLINIPIIYGIVRYISIIIELVIKGLSKIYLIALLTFLYSLIKCLFDRIKDNEKAEEIITTNVEVNGYSEYNISE